jgi:hypothetical protein
MKLITITLALFAGSTFIAAAPIEETTPLAGTMTTATTDPGPDPEGCPNGWAICGVSLVLTSLFIVLGANALHRGAMEPRAKLLVLISKSETLIYSTRRRGI